MKVFHHHHGSISAWKIGLLQTTIVIGYICIGSAVVTSSIVPRLPERIFEFSPALGFLSFLTTFVFSALLCGTAVLGYPALLCFEKQYHRAAHIILWSILWFALFLIGMGLFAMVYADM